MDKRIKGGIYCLGGIYHRKIYPTLLDSYLRNGFRVFKRPKINWDIFADKVDYLKEIPIKEYFYQNANKIDKHGRPIYVWIDSKKYKNYGK